MPFLRPFVKVTAQGNLSDVDIFNFSFHLIGGTDVLDSINLLRGNQTVRNDIVEQIQDIHTSNFGSAPYAELESVKFAYIGTDGKYLFDAQTANFAPLAGGYTNGSTGSAFTGSAISLYGSIARNPGGRGRFYPPANALPADSGFYVGESRQTELAQSWAVRLSNINNILSTGSVGLSIGNVSEKDSGAQQFVTTVRVGSVLDVQRRRKNRAYETYVNSNLSA